MRARRAFLLLTVAALAPACGAKRRPSAIGTAGSPASHKALAGDAEPATLEPRRPIDAGPDVQPLREDAASGQEILGGASGEASPLANIYFDYDAATLSEGALATLSKHAQWLQQNPGAKVAIEGHCDQRGTVEYNLALGELRAQAVREQLVSLGIAAERLATVSYGKEKPIDQAMSDDAFRKNRRAHFVVTR